MLDCIIDACVATKWALKEPDSDRAARLSADITVRGGKLLLLTVAVAEVTNSIWRANHRGLISVADAELALKTFLAIPFGEIDFRPLAEEALRIGIKYRVAVYDAAFVAAVQHFQCEGFTADVPLHHAVTKDYPSIRLLRTY